jgi:hypothetical protein
MRLLVKGAWFQDIEDGCLRTSRTAGVGAGPVTGNGVSHGIRDGQA